MMRLLWICLGGAAGTALRYGVAEACVRLFGPALPIGTLVVNVVGSFALAVVMYLALDAQVIGPDLRYALATGVMGGFTTYSSFNFEASRFFQRGAIGEAVLYIALTVVLCLLAGWAGLATVRALVPAGASSAPR